jgi:hypothetical protein
MTVDSVSKCTFIQTDPVGDKMLQVHIINTLHQLVAHPCAASMTNETTWKILNFAFTVMAISGGKKSAYVLYERAEQTIEDIAAFVLAKAFESGDSTCLAQLLEYFIAVIKKATEKVVEVEDPTKPKGEQQCSAEKVDTSVHSLGELFADTEATHLVFALKMLNLLLLGWGDVSVMQRLFVHSPKLGALVFDNLALSLLLLSSRRHRFPANVLQVTSSALHK